MKYLFEDTVRAVLVAAVQDGQQHAAEAIASATGALIAADRLLEARAATPSWTEAKAPAAPQPPYPPVTDERAVREMSRTGDTFIRALAAAWEHGDANNRKRIRTGWADEFRRFATLVHYQEMARQAEHEGRN
ncbi:hypothetical protein [Achromobacter denitrificans]|uniref:Uncharacterized protein n=1 Tax=Achromobacter denitrificans TaxID=32002 RepID=A0ABZ3G8L6_ACHDE